MSAIDFSLPTKTQQYDTGFLSTLRSQQIALASFLDGAAISTNTAGIKRYNAGSQLFEKSDGSAWTEMPLGYVKKSGDSMSGPLLLVTDPGPTSPLNQAATKNYVLGIASGYAPLSALGGYAPLSGGTFSGSVSVQGSFSVGSTFGASGNVYSASGFTTAGNVTAGDGALSTAGLFSMTAYGTALPVIQWDSNDSLRYDRAANELELWIGGSLIASQTALISAFMTRMSFTSDTGANYGAEVRYINPSTGSGPTTRVNPVNSMEWVNAAYSQLNATLSDTGDFTPRGLLYGRGGGSGLGQITVQSGGSPSGGADGDLLLIY